MSSEDHLNKCLVSFIHSWVYRNDAVSHGGGTAILVANDLFSTQMNCPRSECFHNPVAVKIFCEEANYVFVSAYVSNETNQIQSRDLSNFLRLGNRVVIAGDFNARHSSWNCRSTNSRGRGA